MATDNIYSALLGMTRANTNIASKLGFFVGTTIPLVNDSVLDKTETALPAITIRPEKVSELYKNIGDDNFIFNCFGSNGVESYNLAKTLIYEWDDTPICYDGWNMRLTATGISQNANPDAKEINTPVVVRVVYWR